MNCLTITALIIISLAYRGVAKGGSSQDDTLLLVHTVFRHGNRTPDSKGYASNPINKSYYPEGYGQLTNEGKRTEYRLGTTLRQRYNSFLGRTWNINYLEARSTNFTRTKMSLQLVLAGLYPPRGDQIWTLGLNWQPIAYNVLQNDKELSWFLYCEKYLSELSKVHKSDEIQQAITVYDDVFNYLSNKTGKNVSTPLDVFALYFDLVTQKEYGYPLEDWVNSLWPETFVKIAVDAYYIYAKTTTLKQGSGGSLLKKMLRDSKAKIDGTISPSNLKMYLYSGHELNIATLLLTLGVFDDKVPSYGSHIILELHLINSVYGFKVFHQDWSTRSPKLLTIPGCTAFCPYDEFVALVAEKEYGYPLEDWVNSLWPETFVKIAVDAYYIYAKTTTLKQGSGGSLLKKMLRDSKAKIDGTISPSNLKMYLYSGHELNIATLLLTLGVYDDKVPSYGSHIILELHLINSVYGFKVFHQDWSTRSPKLLTIPGCTAFCPYDEFVALVAEVIPSNDFC